MMREETKLLYHTRKYQTQVNSGQEDIDFTIQDSIKENYGRQYCGDLPVLLVKLNVHSVRVPPGKVGKGFTGQVKHSSVLRIVKQQDC